VGVFFLGLRNNVYNNMTVARAGPAGEIWMVSPHKIEKAKILLARDLQQERVARDLQQERVKRGDLRQERVARDLKEERVKRRDLQQQRVARDLQQERVKRRPLLPTALQKRRYQVVAQKIGDLCCTTPPSVSALILRNYWTRTRKMAREKEAGERCFDETNEQ
jgi:hypothetical protein